MQCFKTSVILLLTSALLLSGCGALSVSKTTYPQHDANRNVAFTVIPLGTFGGLYEDNLSSYLIAAGRDNQYIVFDAGSIMSGLKVAAAHGTFSDIVNDSALSTEGYVLRHAIKGYAVSHPHLDHISGLVINATDDTPKPIYALPETIQTLKDHVFNWAVWPNFANEGSGYTLNQYRYNALLPAQPQQTDEIDCRLTAYPLSHSGGYTSTAFLLQCDDNAVLYIGDTGPDAVENSDHLASPWQTIAPIIRNNNLKGIFIEASYPSARSDDDLFGHLTPAWVMEELTALANYVDDANPDDALEGLKVIVTHVKPSLRQDEDTLKTIKNELDTLNNLGVHFVFPQQGNALYL